MVRSSQYQQALEMLNHRKNRVLTYAQASVTEHQFKALRSLILDELGKNGFEGELAKLLNERNHSDE